MRQQLADGAGFLRWQPCQHVLQVGIGLMPVQLGRLDQAHHISRPLPGAERTRYSAQGRIRFSTRLLSIMIAPSFR